MQPVLAQTLNGVNVEQSFYGATEEDTSRARAFLLDGDEPPVLLGANRGPNAVEAVLHALASCLAVGFVYNAAAQGIRVDALDFDLEGDLDLQGFLGPPSKSAPVMRASGSPIGSRATLAARKSRSSAGMCRTPCRCWTSSAIRYRSR